MKKGFTLIELIVVVVIVGILSGVALPQYQKFVLKSRYHSIMPLVDSIYQGQQLYFLEHGEYAPSVADLNINISMSGSRVSEGLRCYVELSNKYTFCLLFDKSGNNVISYLRYFHNNIRKCIAYEGREPAYSICRQETGDTDPHPTNWFSYPN